MSRTTFGMVAFTVLVMSGCGNSKTFADKPRPAIPVNLTVYVNNARVSVSPDSIGAGEVVFFVTNQSRKAQSITIRPAGASAPSLARTGPINPQETAQVTVEFSHPGSYQVAAVNGGSSDAAAATPPSIHPASLRVGAPRPGSTNQLLQP